MEWSGVEGSVVEFVWSSVEWSGVVWNDVD